MKSLLIAIALTVTTLMLAACGADPAANQRLSQSNATFNGKNFIASKLPGAGYVEFDSDSSITKSCPGGDGWASGVAYTDGGKVVDNLKCQTNGSTKGFKGCLTKDNFEKKPAYVNMEGTCDKTIGTIVDLQK